MVELRSKNPIPAGDLSFRLCSADAELLRTIEAAWHLDHEVAGAADERLLNVDRLVEEQLCRLPGAEAQSIRDDQASLYGLAIDVVRQAVADCQTGRLYCHGVAFVEPERKRTIMLLGLSFAGKSTLSMALCFKHNWRMIVEDIIYFDEQDQILVSPNPLSLREPSASLLREYGAAVPEPIVQGWIAARAAYVDSPVPAKFDLVILLKEAADAGMALQWREVEASELLRIALATSNALHFDDGADRLFKYISSACCLTMSGGSIAERCQLILSKLSQ